MAAKKSEVKPEVKPTIVAPAPKQEETKEILSQEEKATIKQAFGIASSGFPPSGLKEKLEGILQKLGS